MSRPWNYDVEEVFWIRHERIHKELFLEDKWSIDYDQRDIFDLRYLFDEEEVQERKKKYAEQLENGLLIYDENLKEYFDGQFLEFRDEHPPLEDEERADENGFVPMIIEWLEEENWDDDDDQPWNFNIIDGWYLNNVRYDSGYDEPDTPIEGEPHDDEEIIDELFVELLQRMDYRNIE